MVLNRVLRSTIDGEKVKTKYYFFSQNLPKFSKTLTTGVYDLQAL